MFIQIIQGKCTHPDEMRALTERWVREIGPGAEGWLGGTFGVTDEGDMVAVVRFESREAAQANSERPEQSAWWAEAEKLYDGPVEFHDCDRVMLMMDGGSDDAGFVQVIRGRITDPDALESGIRRMESLLHEARPEILGATFALEDDGSFIETVAFTDEATARQAEARGMPTTGAMADALRDYNHTVHNTDYLDLHHPWFASRG